MGFRITVFSGPAQNPNKPRHRGRWLPKSWLLQTQRRPRPSPLAIVRERLFLNGGSEGPLAIRDMRRFVNGGRQSRTPSPRRGLSFPV
jgi:hypothetical protein